MSGARGLWDETLRARRFQEAQTNRSVLQLNRLIWRISRDIGRPGDLPYLDPTFGGVDADVVLLLKAPQADAAPSRGGSRLISLDNDDVGAANLFAIMRDLGIDRRRCVAWNICPFPVASFDPTPEEFVRGRRYFKDFIDSIESPEVILTLGSVVRVGWMEHSFAELARGCRVVHGPSPSPPGIGRPGAMDRLREAFSDAFDV